VDGGFRLRRCGVFLAGVASGCVVVWFTLGMNNGPLLSENIKSRVWPWAGTMSPEPLVAQTLSDPVWQFVPWLQFARREIMAGRLPLWNPHQDGGVPLLGNGQSALASPLLAPVLLFGVTRGWNLSLLARLALAGVASFAWLRSRRRSVPASLLGAVMFALSGPFVAWLEHPHTLALAATPLVLLFVERLAAGGGRREVAGLGLFSALVLVGGHPETALMVGALAVAWLLFLTRDSAALARAAGGTALGACLAAPVLLPLVEYLRLSEAASGVGRAPFVLPRSALVRFVIPHAAAGSPVEGAATVSIIGLLLALAAVPAARRVREVRFWLGVAVVIGLVAYDGPVARALAEATPVHWSRALLLAPLALGVLASHTLDAVGSRLERRLSSRRVRRLLLAVPFVAAAELLVAARGVHATTQPEEVAGTTPLLETLRADHGVFRVLPLHTFLPPDSATALGLDDLRGYDALNPRGWRIEREAIGHFTSTNIVTDVLEPWDLARGGRALDLWNVKYLLLQPQLPYDAETLNRGFALDLETVYDGPDGRILRNRRVEPRAVLEDGGRVRIVKRTATRWVFDLEMPTATTLRVANPYFPGWVAEMDGSRVRFDGHVGEPIRVPVPAGLHRVELVYRPISFLVGVVLAAAGWIVVILVCWLGRRAPPKQGTGGKQQLSTEVAN
jgi:hypothetical protein